MNYNHVVIVGRVGVKRPNLYHVDASDPTKNRIFFTVIENENYKDRTGKPASIMNAIPVQAWGKLADVCNQFLSVGKTLTVDGMIRANYNKEKNVNYFVVRANRIKFGPDSAKVRALKQAGQNTQTATAPTLTVQELEALKARRAELEAYIKAAETGAA